MRYIVVVYEVADPPIRTKAFDTEAMTPEDAVKNWADQLEAEESA